MIVVSVTADQAEAASAALWGMGVTAVEERTLDDQSVELRTSLGDDVTCLPADFSWSWHIEHVDDEVVETWKRFAQPTWVTDTLVVTPEWCPPVNAAGVTELTIDPGSTFGLGDHPTTVLSLATLRAVVRSGCTVLDVGSGSGVLAIGAALFGARQVTAIDISPAAVPVGARNALRNGVAHLIDFSNEPAHSLTGHYDVVVANILAPALVALSSDLTRLCAGTLIVSGLLTDRTLHVTAALQPFEVVNVAEHNGWSAVTLTRRAT